MGAAGGSVMNSGKSAGFALECISGSATTCCAAAQFARFKSPVRVMCKASPRRIRRRRRADGGWDFTVHASRNGARGAKISIEQAFGRAARQQGGFRDEQAFDWCDFVGDPWCHAGIGEHRGPCGEASAATPTAPDAYVMQRSDRCRRVPRHGLFKSEVQDHQEKWRHYCI